MTGQVEQQEQLQYEMERELMKRNPMKKVLRRDNELSEVMIKAEDAERSLAKRSNLLKKKP